MKLTLESLPAADPRIVAAAIVMMCQREVDYRLGSDPDTAIFAAGLKAAVERADGELPTRLDVGHGPNWTRADQSHEDFCIGTIRAVAAVMIAAGAKLEADNG